MPDIQKDNKRGAFMVTMFSVYCLLYLLRLLSILFVSLSVGIYENGPSWLYGFNISIFIFGLIGLVSIFYWKKWGVYLLGLVTVIPIIVDFTAFAKHPSIIQVLITLCLLALFISAIKGRWNYFR